MAEKMRLSVIDTMSTPNVRELVGEIEELGYHRFWTSEDHLSTFAGTSPAIVTSFAASNTAKLRVGSAAILLSYHSPLDVAGTFSELERLYPGRIDLGLASSQVVGPLGVALLDGRDRHTAETHGRRVAEVVKLFESGLPNGNDEGFRQSVSVPEIWICGTSKTSATLAGRLGISYAFHHFMHQGLHEHAIVADDGESVMNAYREGFKPSLFLSEPRDVVAVYGMCCESESDAVREWGPHFEKRLKPTFLGNAAQCHEQIMDIRDRYQARELVIQSMAPSPRRRIESYHLLARQFGIGKDSAAIARDSVLLIEARHFTIQRRGDSVRISTATKDLDIEPDAASLIQYISTYAPVLRGSFYARFAPEFGTEELRSFLTLMQEHGVIG